MRDSRISSLGSKLRDAMAKKDNYESWKCPKCKDESRRNYPFNLSSLYFTE